MEIPVYVFTGLLDSGKTLDIPEEEYITGSGQKKLLHMVKVPVRGENGAEKRIAPHKNVALRRHACITTYYGLRELIEYKFGILYPGEDIRKVAPSDARLRELYNIYQYDYMDLDRLYSEIASMGYVIVEA